MGYKALDKNLIAPCGMNCGICMAYLRNKNVCRVCRNMDESYAKSCVSCIIRNCEILMETDSKFCYDCEKYPCNRLKQLDKRYRTKYHMSMLENLDYIKKFGLEKFVEKEHKRWKCPECGGTVCVHRDVCFECGYSMTYNN